MELRVPFEMLHSTVAAILARPHDLAWSMQGFGMLRCYFAGKRYRLNIWHSGLAVPLCSIIHDHPWRFRSWVLAGDFENVRYKFETRLAPTHKWQVIRTGEGGGPEGEQGFCCLHADYAEQYVAGDTYEQTPKEIHASYFTDGTVTINDRTYEEDSEHARVFWPVGSEWIDAMPRPATRDEIHLATSTALQRMTEFKVAA